MTKIALFGSSGQIGQAMLRALLSTTFHEIISIDQPASEDKAKDIAVGSEDKRRLKTVGMDILEASTDEIASTLGGVEVVVSALNGKALTTQGKIQDAADKAGVRRFFPSEYGMHHIYTDEKGRGILHPTWNMKEEAISIALHHPAIAAGRMTYTLIGCGDFYNQDREKVWCPWTQRDAPSYTLHILGDADAKVDFTHINDLAAFLVATIDNPSVSENKSLNIVSDHLSYNELAALLEKYSKKEVRKVVYPIEAMHRAWKDPQDIPEEVKGKSAFPDDFWMLVKGMQGSGRFWRPPGQVHNDLFPDLKVMTFERYFQSRFTS
ncbi:uncharacterized protein DSM5745_09716 [Aspergillus mulundensis]|uniref:NmrA-like domain-containing protein n=1 Tax=Aspergillus mulundensis TaxID=1810919 RepID=A0A3D8QR82_9EURO|nr:Uncharacterized protein DSM5745_09716 [Aspergillus mulundensis]RDW64305.1 Uncharacterized protein DSM5745_09716 [Aspergillus mulundensis]